MFWLKTKKIQRHLKAFPAFLFTIFAAVNFFLFIGKDEYMGQFLFDGSDAAWVPAFDDIPDFLWI